MFGSTNFRVDEYSPYVIGRRTFGRQIDGSTKTRSIVGHPVSDSNESFGRWFPQGNYNDLCHVLVYLKNPVCIYLHFTSYKKTLQLHFCKEWPIKRQVFLNILHRYNVSHFKMQVQKKLRSATYTQSRCLLFFCQRCTSIVTKNKVCISRMQ
jgi:hypothetical protein